MLGDYQEIGRIMIEYDKKFKYFIKNALKKYDMTVAEALTLLSLFENDGQTQDQLRSTVYYDKSVMTRTMQALEERSLVSRSDNPDDRRSWFFHLTDAGRELEPEIIEALRNWCNYAFAGMNDEDSHQLMQIMMRVQSNINKG